VTALIWLCGGTLADENGRKVLFRGLVVLSGLWIAIVITMARGGAPVRRRGLLGGSGPSMRPICRGHCPSLDFWRLCGELSGGQEECQPAVHKAVGKFRDVLKSCAISMRVGGLPLRQPFNLRAGSIKGFSIHAQGHTTVRPTSNLA
jgi:hypothetical protein